MDRGIWIDGKVSEEEMKKLQETMRRALEQARKGLAFEYKDDKLAVEAFLAEKSMVVVRYVWNYPPKDLWIKEDKDVDECFLCFPDGPNTVAAREVWCSKLSYHYPRCPYGVSTRGATRMPDAM